MLEKVHETFTLVNENQKSNDCSKFNELADMLKDARADLNEYVEFMRKLRWTYQKNSVTFLSQSLYVTSMARFKAIKIVGYQNFTHFLNRDINEANSLITFTERIERNFRLKSCVDCRGTEFFHPVFCSAINFVISTPKYDPDERYTTFLEGLDTFLIFVSFEMPSIFKNFALCSRSRRLSFDCIMILTETLERLDNYMGTIRSIANIFEITALFFTTFNNNSIMDDFIDIQISSHRSRGRFLIFEYDYFQTIYDRHSDILLNGA